MRFIQSIFLALLLAGAATASDSLLNRLRPHGPVNDFAEVIPDITERQLSAHLSELQRRTGDAVVIVTLPSLDGGQIDDFANRLYARWGIGARGRDNGVLLLTAIEERKARIEVGYGLEALLPDARTGRILRESIFPQFKQKRYGAGIVAGTAQIVQCIAAGRADPFLSRGDPARSRRQSARKTNPLVKLLFGIGFLYMAIRHPRFLLFLLLTSGRSGGRSSGGGFGGGGFGGFGGGSSGGGGASGGW